MENIPVSTIVTVYLVISVLIAIKHIITGQAYEDYMDSVPIGDSYLHEPRGSLFNWATTIFFPAAIIIDIWMSIVNFINSRFF